MELKTFITLRTKAHRARKWCKKYKTWLIAGLIAFIVGLHLGINYMPKAGAYEGYKTKGDVLHRHRSIIKYGGEKRTGADSRLYWMYRRPNSLYHLCDGLEGQILRLCGDRYKDFDSYKRPEVVIPELTQLDVSQEEIQ